MSVAILIDLSSKKGAMMQKVNVSDGKRTALMRRKGLPFVLR
jgi:hypothetical protein